GWTTQELAEGMDLTPLQPGYDLVSLQIGVNNQYRGESADTYRTSFRMLLARAVALASARARRVLVVSIPDWGDTPYAHNEGRASFRVARDVDGYNTIAREEARAAGAHWVDITPVSRRRSPAWIGADGLHPTTAQYAAWAEVILPAARTALA
ncbi:MAG: GDSL-type esterase/lipase family protein, partial [Rhodanobacter sp.]